MTMQHLSLSNKQIVLGVSGGIAAYKSAELIRQLQQAGASVRVVMTTAAKAFITPLTLQALSGYPVYEGLLDTQAEAAMGHIELARWADMILIAPASADIIARIVTGQANDLLTSICLASKAPLAIAPAMNQQMWQDETTQRNMQSLAARRVRIFGPDVGEQACGEVGPGRMLEVEALVEACAGLFATTPLQGCRVLVTAGPTREAIDPVRYLSNHSSGKMGYAIAQAAVEVGATVHVVSGPVHIAAPERVRLTQVESAAQMHAAVLQQIENTDIFISAAAVADYTVAAASAEKISKQSQALQLDLVPTKDILKEVALLADRPFCVGFCAQTHDLLQHARRKLTDKKLDMIAANLVGDGVGFSSDDNSLTILWNGGQQALAQTSKRQLARQLITLVTEQYHAKHTIKDT